MCRGDGRRAGADAWAPQGRLTWSLGFPVSLTRALALDCEMVGVGPRGEDSIAARVSVVNQFGKCVYDKYVKPAQQVTDYRTAVSGIRPEDLQQGEPATARDLEGTAAAGFALLPLLPFPERSPGQGSCRSPTEWLSSGPHRLCLCLSAPEPPGLKTWTLALNCPVSLGSGDRDGVALRTRKEARVGGGGRR